jgi:hypothetical protein
MIIVYALVSKLILYSIWCYFGMRLFRSPRLLSATYLSPVNSNVSDGTEQSAATALAKQALGLGFFRLAIGLVVGALAILVAGFIMQGASDGFDRGVLVYALFLVPARALEWWITSKVIGTTSTSARVLLWVFGGVVLSCLADIPMSFAVVGSFIGFC